MLDVPIPDYMQSKNLELILPRSFTKASIRKELVTLNLGGLFKGPERHKEMSPPLHLKDCNDGSSETAGEEKPKKFTRKQLAKLRLPETAVELAAMPSFRVAAATAANSHDPEAPTAYCAQKRKCCCCELPRYAKCSVCLAAVYLALMPCVYLLGHFLVYPGSDFVATFHGTSCKQFVFPGRQGRSIPAAHCPLGSFGSPKNATPVVAFGGNGMNMYDVLLNMDTILPTEQQQWDLYSISFPGSQYAPNTGWTTEGRAEEDAEDLLQYVHNLAGRAVVVYGWSLGTSVAASLAAKKSDAVQCVLLGNPFTSIRDVALAWTKNFAWPYLYLVDEWPTARWAKQFRAPTIVMSSTQDQVVPQEMHRKIYETVPSEKFLVELPLQHMDID
ncbi:Abhd13, partial [Symbiodinium sp. KB8]